MAERRPPDLPAHVGPCEFGTLGKLVAVRCPRYLDPLMRRAGGQWEPGSRRWLIERRRIGPLIRKLERATDPLSAGGDRPGREGRSLSHASSRACGP
jgi:hypothetical protein